MSDRLEHIRKIVSEQFHSGTRVTNCVSHMEMPFDARPDDCRLCLTDLRNQFNFAARVNEWLNDKLDKVREAVQP